MSHAVELSARLEDIFRDIPPERKSIDFIRGLRWAIDEEKMARLRCFTLITGFDGDGRVKGEFEYPRSYVAELAFPLHDPNTSICVAHSVWRVTEPSSEARRDSIRLMRFDASLGIDAFELADLGNPKPDPGKEIALFREGFFQPYIFALDGFASLLDSRGVANG